MHRARRSPARRLSDGCAVGTARADVDQRRRQTGIRRQRGHRLGVPPAVARYGDAAAATIARPSARRNPHGDRRWPARVGDCEAFRRARLRLDVPAPRRRSAGRPSDRSLMGRLAERLYRNVRIGWTALCVWLRYKTPLWWDALLRREPGKRDMAAIHQRNADQIFNTAVSMRGMLVKMCQVVGTRSDIFPPQYVKTLSQCHDRLPARDFETVKRVVEADFGRPLSEVFSEFSPTAIAAASLAQVHRARLVDGRIVAVKVQYPDIDHIIRTDLTASRRVAVIYQRFDSNP